MVGFKLFNYPHQAIFGKVLPKNKIYEFTKPSNAIKDMFIRQVAQITWAYKLSPETLNMTPGEGVKEIQIFKLQSKVPEISEDILRVIDDAISTNIFYEVEFDGRCKLIACYKRQNISDASKWVAGPYYESDWVSAESERCNIPVALNLGGLYTLMLRMLMPTGFREGESLDEQVNRLEYLKAKTAELSKLRAKLNKEKQFNRRVEINSKIKVLQNEISQSSS